MEERIEIIIDSNTPFFIKFIKGIPYRDPMWFISDKEDNSGYVRGMSVFVWSLDQAIANYEKELIELNQTNNGKA